MGVSQHICHCILGLSQVGLNNSDPSLRSELITSQEPVQYPRLLISKPRLPSLANKETMQFIT